MTNDKKIPSSVYSSMQRRNAIRGSGSTWWGRTRDSAQSMFLGSSPVDKMDAQIEGYNEASSLIKSIISKADVDSKWQSDYKDENGNALTMKELNKRYDLLKNSNADPAQLAAARDAVEKSRDKLLGDVLTGKYKDGPFAPQMQTDLANIRGIERSRGIKLLGAKGGVNEHLEKDDVSGAVSMFKALQYTAADDARNMKNTSKYSSRKKNQQLNKH